MTSLTPNMKNCASCEYWGGTRKPDIFCQRVCVNSSCDKGRCLNRKGFWNTEKTAVSTCSHYVKWGVLK